jgi:phosphoheptose isomerase
MTTCLSNGGKILVCGNGGSAADAQHFAAEFVGRFKYPDRKGLPVMALTADTAFLTAWANDVSYEKVFSRQVEAFGQPGDVLFAISTSGNSRNLVEACAAARRRGLTCIALLGGSGGDVLPLADLAIVVPSTDTARIQEVQILVLHLLTELVEGRFLPDRLMPGVFLGSDSLAAHPQPAVRPAWGLEPVRVALDDEPHYPDQPFRPL